MTSEWSFSWFWVQALRTIYLPVYPLWSSLLYFQQIQVKFSNEVNYYGIASGERKMVMSLTFESWLLFPHLGSATYSLYDFGHITSFLSCGGLEWLNFPFLKVLVAQSCLVLFDPMDCSLPGFSVHGISQARILELVAMPSSRGSSRPRDWTCISCIGRWILYHCATWEAPCVN